MTFTALLVRDVTILTPTTSTDRYGNSIATSWTSTVTKGWLDQQTSSEGDGLRRDQDTEWVLFLAADTVITGRDRVQVGSDVYEVAGNPNRAWTPAGEHHVEARLRRVDG